MNKAWFSGGPTWPCIGALICISCHCMIIWPIYWDTDNALSFPNVDSLKLDQDLKHEASLYILYSYCSLCFLTLTPGVDLSQPWMRCQYWPMTIHVCSYPWMLISLCDSIVVILFIHLYLSSFDQVCCDKAFNFQSSLIK